MGGVGSDRLQVLEMTQENGLSWSRKADLPALRQAAGSMLHEGKIWVMGGFAGGPTASVISYDAEADAWSTGPPLPDACWGCKAATNDSASGIPLVHSSHGCFQYTGAAWSVVTGPPGAAAPCCGSVFLG